MAKIDDVKRIVADSAGVPVAVLDGGSEDRTAAQARHLAMYLAYRTAGKSFATIGRHFGGRVGGAVRKVEANAARSPRMPTIGQVKTVVADAFGVSADQLGELRRDRCVVEARHVAMYLARRLTGRSFRAIGLQFGRRDHTTVMHAVRQTEQRVAEDTETRVLVDALSHRLTGAGRDWLILP